MNAPAAATGTATTAPKKPATEIKTIKMDDGRTVDFPGKRRLQKTVTADDKGVVVRLDFVNGETRTVTLPVALMAKAAGHGLSQKLGDEISGVTDLEDAVLAIDELSERIKKGEWNESSTGGEGLAGASILMKALIEVTGKSKDEIKAFLGSLNPKQKAALREDASIKPTVQKLEAEKAAKAQKPGTPAIDTGALLASIGKGGAPASSVFTQPGTAPATGTGNSPSPNAAQNAQTPAVVGKPEGGKGAPKPSAASQEPGK